MAKSKKITKTNLASMIKAQNKTRTITVQGDHDLKIEEIFSESKIDSLIADYLDMFEQAGANMEMTQDLIEGSSMLIFALIIREFTDIGVIPKGSNVQEIYPVARAIYDLGKVSKESQGLMAEIIDAFDKSQIERVFDKLAQMTDNVNEQITRLAIAKSGALATRLKLEEGENDGKIQNV